MNSPPGILRATQGKAITEQNLFADQSDIQAIPNQELFVAQIVCYAVL